MIENPFIYSDDNKRYYTWNYYLKHRYGQKVCKVPLDAHFTCPNRDGTKGISGCLFCSSKGSGDFAAQHLDLNKQFEDGKAMMQRKWPDSLLIAYFQAFSNTYGTVEHLKEVYEPFSQRADIEAIAIATRPDCIDEEIADYLASLNVRKELWIELGLQSIHEKSEKYMQRKHGLEEFEKSLGLLRERDIKVVAHIMNSLPYETAEDMLETAKYIAKQDIQALKIHMLHVMKETKLGEIYQKQPFPLLSLEEYRDIVIKQLEVLPPNLIIQRLTGDAPKDLLIAPDWTLKKTIVLNEIDKKMAKDNTYQGRLYQGE